MFTILAEAAPQCDAAFTVDTSLLSILASIMVFVSLINNLYKLQVIDEIRAWVVKIEKDFVARFSSLKLDMSKEEGRRFLAENENILRKSLKWNQYYNLAVCVSWAVIVIIWLVYPNYLKNNIILGIIYGILFLGSIIVYRRGCFFNKKRNECLSKAEAICAKDDNIYKDAEKKINSAASKKRNKRQGREEF